MRLEVQVILENGRIKASEGGMHIAQSFPASTTIGHITPSDQLTNEHFNDQVVSHHILHRDQAPGGDEGASAYSQTRVFYTAEEIASGDLDDTEMPTCFGNTEQAQKYRDALVPEAEPDATIPTTSEDKRKLVHVLFQAFKSVTLAEDNAKFHNTWKKGHDNRLIEVACWELLQTLIVRATIKGQTQGRYHSANPKRQVYEYESFAERFDSVVHVIARNKTMCKALLDAPKTCRLVDDPQTVEEKTDGNRTENRSKAEIIEKGRVVEGAGSSHKRRRAPDTTLLTGDDAKINQSDGEDAQTVARRARGSARTMSTEADHGYGPDGSVDRLILINRSRSGLQLRSAIQLRCCVQSEYVDRSKIYHLHSQQHISPN